MLSMKKAALSLGAAIALASPAFGDNILVENNKTQAIRLAGDAASVVIGNQNIADVAVHDENLLFLSGRTFGTTNLLVFDRDGRKIYSADVTVTSDTASHVTVNRAGEAATYDCAPRCRGVIAVGDSQEHFNDVYQQTDRLKELSE